MVNHGPDYLLEGGLALLVVGIAAGILAVRSRLRGKKARVTGATKESAHEPEPEPESSDNDSLCGASGLAVASAPAANSDPERGVVDDQVCGRGALLMALDPPAQSRGGVSPAFDVPEGE